MENEQIYPFLCSVFVWCLSPSLTIEFYWCLCSHCGQLFLKRNHSKFNDFQRAECLSKLKKFENNFFSDKYLKVSQRLKWWHSNSVFWPKLKDTQYTVVYDKWKAEKHHWLIWHFSFKITQTITNDKSTKRLLAALKVRLCLSDPPSKVDIFPLF